MKRLYVLVRSDLSISQQAVQAGHAVAQWMLERREWENEILVYIGVTHRELREWAEALGDRAVAWREPDWNDQLTAVAVVGKREEFAGLDLL